ncbi:hypothetical protein MPSEU_000230200 [Mayamaea pseudoterrestris]|nr:hypothetical protein MPSEU_000230200 [Mayamaea pseudoterrestris]
MILLTGLELYLVQHVHSNERETASTDANIAASNVARATQRITKKSFRRTIMPPPTPQATSKHYKKPPPPSHLDSAFANCTILRPNDSIYQYGPWDAAPIVLERYQLLLFTIPKVGCTLLKTFCRRVMGYQDWRDDVHPLPHAPKRNGLSYLYDYPPSVADGMLTSNEWTRAMIVREPLERLLSAYLDKGVQNQYMQFHCCRGLMVSDDDESDDSDDDMDTAANITAVHKHFYNLLQCSNKKAHQGPIASELESKGQDKSPPLLTFRDFLFLIKHHPHSDCRNDPHWKPQSLRLDLKYWKSPGFINFIGYMDSMADDIRQLLTQVGAWDEHGSNGWPPHGGAMFDGPVTVHHATDSSSKLNEYYSSEHQQVAALSPVMGEEKSTLDMAKDLCEDDYRLIPGLVMPKLSQLDGKIEVE